MKINAGRVRFETRGDLPVTAASLGRTGWNRTGSWKFMEPFHRDMTPPCSDRCLSGIDVVEMMRRVEAGDWEGAARSVLPMNPFPAITGRVCPHPCMTPCNRKAHGGGINVRNIEREVGDRKLARRIHPVLPPQTLPAVHVVGSGPAGLSAAVTLRTLGHPVVVHEAADEAGGMLRYSLPGFRLPLDVVRREIEWVRDLGVAVQTGTPVFRKDYDGFGPTVLAMGLGRPRALGIPGEDLRGVHDAVRFLADVRRDAPPDLGDRVAVIGGGTTALDAARTLLRLGSEPVVLYRRSLREMTASREEIEGAREEGIEIRFLIAPVAIEARPGGGLLLTLVATSPGETDGSGRPRPEPRPGTESVLEVDSVVRAIGATLAEELLPEGVATEGGVIVADGNGRTGRGLVYACGDGTPGAGRSVAEAIRAGRDCAVALHEEVAGKPLPGGHPLRPRDDRDPAVAKFKDLNMAWFEKEAPRDPHRLAPALRTATFDPVEEGLPEDLAREEATRCFKCGTCTGCDTCLTFCPDFAIVRRPEGGYAVDLDYCKGCGVCVEECPRAAVHLRRATS